MRGNTNHTCLNIRQEFFPNSQTGKVGRGQLIMKTKLNVFHIGIFLTTEGCKGEGRYHLIFKYVCILLLCEFSFEEKQWISTGNTSYTNSVSGTQLTATAHFVTVANYLQNHCACHKGRNTAPACSPIVNDNATTAGH
jgi:hypothetical protein